MHSKRSTGINVGGSSILVIFVLLCLTTFATLSMVSANADYKLTQQSALATSAYYRADAAAESRLAEIDAVLRDAHSAAADSLAYFGIANAQLSMLDGVSVEVSGASATVTYAVAVNDTQELSVELVLPYPAGADAERYTVRAWKVVNTAPLTLGEDEPVENLFDPANLSDLLG